MKNVFLRFLLFLRKLIGVAQIILILNGCFALLAPAVYATQLEWSVRWFLILLVAQVVILLLIYLTPKDI